MLSELGNLGGLAMSGCIVIAFGFVYVLTAWIRNAAVKPDPWGAEVRQTIDSPDTPETCHHCSTPQERSAWFCPYCGCAVGPYNNLMPYVHVFSVGEVFRNGAADKMRGNSLTIGGYLLYSLSNYFVFAPVYWYFLFKNLTRIKREEAQQPSLEVPGG